MGWRVFNTFLNQYAAFGDGLVWRRCETMGGGGGFINLKYMYNNGVGKGGVRVYEAHEVK